MISLENRRGRKRGSKENAAIYARSWEKEKNKRGPNARKRQHSDRRGEKGEEKGGKTLP